MCDGSRIPSMRSTSIKTWCLLCLRHSQTQLHSLSLTVQEYPKGLCPNVVSDALNLDLSRDCRLTLPSHPRNSPAFACFAAYCGKIIMIHHIISYYIMIYLSILMIIPGSGVFLWFFSAIGQQQKHPAKDTLRCTSSPSPGTVAAPAI